jgi:hypothetical protein
MPTQYPEDELETIDLKAWECAETLSRAGKASDKQRQTPGATRCSDGEQPPPYPQQRRKRSAADLSNHSERPMKRRRASAPHASWIILICPSLMPTRKPPTRSLQPLLREVLPILYSVRSHRLHAEVLGVSLTRKSFRVN